MEIKSHIKNDILCKGQVWIFVKNFFWDQLFCFHAFDPFMPEKPKMLKIFFSKIKLINSFEAYFSLEREMLIRS